MMSCGQGHTCSNTLVYHATILLLNGMLHVGMARNYASYKTVPPFMVSTQNKPGLTCIVSLPSTLALWVLLRECECYAAVGHVQPGPSGTTQLSMVHIQSRNDTIDRASCSKYWCLLSNLVHGNVTHLVCTDAVHSMMQIWILPTFLPSSIRNLGSCQNMSGLNLCRADVDPIRFSTPQPGCVGRELEYRQLRGFVPSTASKQGSTREQSVCACYWGRTST
jgi:hypothetical protein